jgi:DNA-binding CsgD family transcriptional regulator
VGDTGLGWPLVGRDGELAMLDAEVGRRAGCVVLAGPLGVGKSRLLVTWAARRTERTERTEQPERPGAAAGRTGSGVVVVRATRSTATIPFGAFAGWVPAQLGGSGDRLAVLQAAAGQLVREGGGVAVAVDDAHLLDEGSAALVLHLVQHTSLGVLVTVRSGEPCPDAVVAIWKEGLGRRVDLPPLTEGEATELLERALGGPPAPAARRRVWQLAQGNPMYLTEVVDAARGQGVLVREGGAWAWRGALSGPTRLVELVRDRIGTAEPAGRRVLETVALGEPLPVDVLVRVAPAAALADAEERGLVVVERPPARGAGPVARLVHPLYAEVLRAELPALRARGLAAELGEAAVAVGMDERDPVRVATWLLDGGGGAADPDVLVRASLRARFVDDYELSARFAEEAERAGGGWRATLVRAIALGPLGRLDRAEALLASISTPGSEPEARVAAAHVRAEQSLWYRGEDLRAALAIVTGAAATIPAPERSALLGYGAELALGGLHLDEAVELATCAHRDAGSLVDRLHAVAAAGLVAVARGRTGAALAAVEMALPGAVASLGEDPLPGLYVGLLYSLGSVFGGRIDEAAAFFEDGLARGIVPDQGLSPTFMTYWTGRAALEQGRVGTASRLCGEALAAFGDRNHYGRGTWIATTLALAAAQSGDAATAGSAVAWIDARTRARIEADDLFAELARAWLCAARGELSSARATAAAAAGRAGERGAWGIEALALVHAARLGATPAVAARLEHLAGVVEGPYVGVAARFARAAVGGDGAGLDEASAGYAGLGARLHAAEAAAAAAEAHAAAGRRRRRADSWAAAHALAAGCEGAATPLLARLGQEPLAAVLTAREREVAELAARGRTSRDIAEALGVSVRTVHSHLNHAYAKLGIGDRGELAALLGVDARR